VAGGYTPARGDIVWLEFDPQSGHEEAGLRPALVISPVEYNRKVGLALFCPITSKIKGYPFEVTLPAELAVLGAVLTDQIKSLGWRTRKAKKVCTIPGEVLTEIIKKISLLIEE